MSFLGTISEITIYPIKSFAGIKLKKAIVGKYGLIHPDYSEIADRKWMVVDENGSFLAQRQIPKMALVKTTIDQNGHIILSALGKESISIDPKGHTNIRKRCRVFNLPIEGYMYGPEINKWISEFIEKENCYLVTFANDLEPRKTKLIDRPSNKGREDDLIMYPDYSPFMLISENSLNELNKKLEKKVSMRNFRPNFVVSDCEAFTEDNWCKFAIGESKFTKIKHCTRCLLVTVDQDKGFKDPKMEPLQTLKEFRTNKEAYGVAPMFGINFAPDNIGNFIFVGDKITKLE